MRWSANTPADQAVTETMFSAAQRLHNYGRFAAAATVAAALTTTAPAGPAMAQRLRRAAFYAAPAVSQRDLG